jgi:hypothetical protein
LPRPDPVRCIVRPVSSSTCYIARLAAATHGIEEHGLDPFCSPRVRNRCEQRPWPCSPCSSCPVARSLPFAVVGFQSAIDSTPSPARYTSRAELIIPLRKVEPIDVPSYGDCPGPATVTSKCRRLSSLGAALIPGGASAINRSVSCGTSALCCCRVTNVSCFLILYQCSSSTRSAVETAHFEDTLGQSHRGWRYW